MILLAPVDPLPPPAGGPFDLSNTFAWIDDHQWSEIVQSETFLLPGDDGYSALLLRVGRRGAGRPITLEGRIPLPTLQDLEALERMAVLISLSIHGGQRTVRFRNSGGAALDFQRLGGPKETPDVTDWYVGRIRMIEVSA